VRGGGSPTTPKLAGAQTVAIGIFPRADVGERGGGGVAVPRGPPASDPTRKGRPGPNLPQALHGPHPHILGDVGLPLPPRTGGAPIGIDSLASVLAHQDIRRGQGTSRHGGRTAPTTRPEKLSMPGWNYLLQMGELAVNRSWADLRHPQGSARFPAHVQFTALKRRITRGSRRSVPYPPAILAFTSVSQFSTRMSGAVDSVFPRFLSRTMMKRLPSGLTSYPVDRSSKGIPSGTTNSS
jgi:hypothetical protein